MTDFDFGSRTYIMGILNVTPDSFSNDGIYKDVDRSVRQAEMLAEQGADIIDIGGESTRPGAASVTVEEEINRTIPVIKRIAKSIGIPISIDTRKSEVARLSLDNGASMINDITGLESDEKMAGVAAEYGARVVLMHIKGDPLTMQDNPTYENLIQEIKDKLRRLIQKAEEAGIKKENIIIDPGLGFGKTAEHNLEILKQLAVFKGLGRPVMVGPSRKSFIGKLLGVEPDKRIFGTAASVAIAIKNGADIIRAHDVKEIKQVAILADAIVRSGERNV